MMKKCSPVELVETHASNPVPGSPHVLHLFHPLTAHHGLAPLHVVHVGLEQLGVPLVQLAVLLFHLRLLILQPGDLISRVFRLEFEHFHNGAETLHFQVQLFSLCFMMILEF